MSVRKYVVISVAVILGVVDVPSFATTPASRDALAGIGVSAKNTRIIFATRETYDRVIGEKNADARAQVFQRLRTLSGFTSASAILTPSSERLEAGRDGSATTLDPALLSILNRDLAVQIGDFIVRLDLAASKVYALPASHEAEYADLVAGRTANRNIRQFSMRDAVLDLLEEPTFNARCGELSIGDQEENRFPDLDTMVMRSRLKYHGWGIYFALWADVDIKPQPNSASSHVDIPQLYYRVRCGNTVGPYDVTNYSLGNDKSYNSYEGSKPLSALCFRARFHGEVMNSHNVKVTADSGWFDISTNCPPPSGLPPLGLSYPHNPSTYVVGQYSRSNPALIRGPATSWSITPALPSGMKIDPSTGIIDGVPTSVAPPMDRTVTAANQWGATTAQLHMASVALPTAPANIVYPVNPAIYVMNQDILANVPKHSGGVVTSWTISPPLPPGLHLESGNDPSIGSGYIYGRPTAAQTPKQYTVAAKNAGGSATTTLTIEVRDPSAQISGLAYSQNPAVYTVGVAITPNKASLITGVPYSGFTVAPALPDGLILSTTTGEIWGTPQHSQPPKTYTVTAHGSTAQPGASVQLRIAINDQGTSFH